MEIWPDDQAVALGFDLFTAAGQFGGDHKAIIGLPAKENGWCLKAPTGALQDEEHDVRQDPKFRAAGLMTSPSRGPTGADLAVGS